MPRKTKSDPNPVDIHVGLRVKQQRTWLGLSQEKLGDQLGVSFQQVQKYERGTNRISASSLHQIAIALGVEVGYFFVGLVYGGSDGASTGMAESSQDGLTDDILGSKECMDLIRQYNKIKDPKVRRTIFDLAKSLANVEAAANRADGSGNDDSDPAPRPN